MAGRYANAKIGSIELFNHQVRVEGGSGIQTPISNISIPTLGGFVTQSFSLGALGRSFTLTFNATESTLTSVLTFLKAAIAAGGTVIVEITNIYPNFKVNASPQTIGGELYTVGQQSGGIIQNVHLVFKSVSFAG